MSFKPYPRYKESGVEWLGRVPEHWEVHRLKRLCHVFPSNVDKKAVEGEAPVLLCNYTDVYYNDRIVDGMDFMAATATDDQIAKFTLRAGDTIITKDSETADDIAVAAYVPNDLPGVICGYHLSMVRPQEGIHGAYVKRLFDSVYAKSCFAIRANGLTRVGLSQYEIDNVEMPSPPEGEQALIAGFLDCETAKIDALIAEQQRLIELLQEKRQAVISQAVTKGLNPNAPMKDSRIEWLGEVPEHWDVRKLRTLAEIVRGSSPRPAGDPTLFDGDHMPWVTVAEITKDDGKMLVETETYLTALGAEQSRRFEPSTLLYSNSGATLGVPKILGVQACANDGVVGFLRLSDAVNISFLYFFLYSLTVAIREKVKQGSGQPNLNTDIVKGFTVALPPKDEQVDLVLAIEHSLERYAALSNDANRAISLLQERRSALISAAVTGQIDVRGFSAGGGSEAA